MIAPNSVSAVSDAKYLEYLLNMGFISLSTLELDSEIIPRCVHISKFHQSSPIPFLETNSNSNLISDEEPHLLSISNESTKHSNHTPQNPKRWIQLLQQSFQQDQIKGITGLNFKHLDTPALNNLNFIIPYHLPISSNSLYQSGIVFPFDPCSLAPILALRPQNIHDTLDICGSPGTKSILLAESSKTLTNVDISSHRQNVTRNQFVKYSINNGRIYVADAKNFSVLAPTDQCKTKDDFTTFPTFRGIPIWGYNKRPCDEPRGKTARRRWISWRSKIDGLLWCGTETNDSSSSLYHRILVDVECSTDSSPVYLFTRHHETKSSGSDPIGKTKTEISTNTAQSPAISHNTPDFSSILAKINDQSFWDLQTTILLNAFKLLIPGGILCYSTCSLDPRQNELVVQHLLDTQSSLASVLPIPSLGSLEQFRFHPDKNRWNSISSLLNPVMEDNDEPLKLQHLKLGRFYHSGRKGIFLALITKKMQT